MLIKLHYTHKLLLWSDQVLKVESLSYKTSNFSIQIVTYKWCEIRLASMSCFGGIVSIISQRGSLPHDFFWTMLKELFKLHRLFKVFCSRWTACLSRERLHLFFHGWLAYTFRWFGMFLLPFILCSMFLGHESIIVGNPNGMPTYIRLCVSFTGFCYTESPNLYVSVDYCKHVR